jgi:SAM-dependent methyltransferase
LLREARAQVARDGLETVISLQEGSAEELPLNDGSFDVTLCITVLEEGDADRMLSELVRVTKPGGRVATMVRAVDLPWWTNLPLSEGVMAKVTWIDKRVASTGCADATLAQRMISAGLEHVTMTPQLTAHADGTFREAHLANMRSVLSPEEQQEWDRCLDAARAAGTLTLASSYYLAVGVKP